MISKNETFFFGLFSGFTALLLVLIILLWVEEGHDVDEDQAFKEIFPMFRGMAIIIAYVGLLAWNVYGWTKYNVNYKLIFRFNHHYSQLSQVYLFLCLKVMCIDSQKRGDICYNPFTFDALVSAFGC